MIRRSRILIALLAASMFLSACATGDEESSTDGPIVIGGTLGLTGTYSGPSAGYKVAYDFWLKQINESGGLLGRPVELKIYDDESNPSTAQQLYQRLINDDKADLLLAPYTTQVGGAVVPIAERAGKVLFNGGFLSKELHSKSKMMVTSYTYQEPEAAKSFFEFVKTLPTDQRPTKLAVATAQNPFTLVARDGYEGEGGVLRYAEEAGMEVVFNEAYPMTTTDLTSVAQRAKSSGADAFVALGLPNDSALMAKTVHQVGFTPRYYCQCGSQVTTLPNWPDLGAAGVNVLSTTSAWPTVGTKGIAELTAELKDKLHVPALPAYGAIGYSILQVIAEAVEGAKTLDQQELRSYLGKHHFPTAVGDLSYRDDGTTPFSALLLQYQQQGNQVVWPPKVSTSPAATPLRP